MADRHTADDTGKRTFDRRTYLKLAGATAAVAGTGLAGSAAAFPNRYDPDRVIDLGEQGLSEGDVIDPYLEEYVDSNVEVRIPEGEYDWRGRGFQHGTLVNAGIIGEGEVILNAVDRWYRQTVRAGNGVVAIKNLTVRGEVDRARIRLEARHGNGHVVVDNWNFPDGSADSVGARAFFVPRQHAGVVEIRNCYIRGFDDNAIYASAPGIDDAEGGQVIIDGCFSHNNNVAGFRIGGENSIVRNSVVLNDGPAPLTRSGARNQRGIRIDGGSRTRDLLIENCDIIHTSTNIGGGGPIRWSSRVGGTGHFENIRVLNNNGIAAIAPNRSRAEGFSGNNINVTGDGNLSVPDWFTDVCQGGDCSTPDTDNYGSADSLGSDSDSDSEPDEHNGSVPEDDDSSNPTELVLVANGGGVDYTFTTTDEITPLYDRDEYRANRSEPTDYAVERDDGNWTAIGKIGGNGNGDSFDFAGEMVDFSATGDVDNLTVYLDGEEVEIGDLVDDSSGSNPDDSEETSEDDDDSSGNGDADELTNRVIVDGTSSRLVTSYKIVVSGEIEADSSTSSVVDGGTPWDDLDDDVGDDTAVGVVGKGIDGYRYSGEIIKLSLDGAAEMTVESNDL